MSLRFFAAYIKGTFIGGVLILLLYPQMLLAREGEYYNELELYQKIFSAEQCNAYNKALREYNNNTQKNSVSYYGEEIIKIKKLSELFTDSFWGVSPNYAMAFLQALKLEKALDAVKEEQYPEKRADYARLGEVYYLFNDFEKSIAILKKAVTDNAPCSFVDSANLSARKIIGICYANLGQMDTSDYYFRSILESHDLILNRPVYNAYALSYLGCNAMIRGDYEKALVLDSEVLPFFRSYTDYGHLAGMYYCRASSYFALGDIERAGIAADSVLLYANRDIYHPNKRLKQAFAVLARYNALIGNASLTKAYSDSLVNIYKQEAHIHTSQYIANARQAEYKENTEQALVRSEIYRKNMIIGIIISIVIILFSGYTFIQYRRLKSAYRVLVEKSRQWAKQIAEDYNLDPEKISKISAKEEVNIIQLIHNYVIVDKSYLDADLSLDKLAKNLNINRSYLSSAINNIMGKNFNAYINEYRISEAIRMFNDPAYNSHSIDSIYLLSGFNNKRSFYNYFKKITGIPPGEYRENLEK